MMRYVVVGGGVSALSCVEEIRTIDESANITLITASPLLKIITNRQLVNAVSCWIAFCFMSPSIYLRIF